MRLEVATKQRYLPMLEHAVQLTVLVRVSFASLDLVQQSTSARQLPEVIAGVGPGRLEDAVDLLAPCGLFGLLVLLFVVTLEGTDSLDVAVKRVPCWWPRWRRYRR